MINFIKEQYVFTLLVVVLTIAMFVFNNKDLTYMIVGAFVGYLTPKGAKSGGEL